MRNIITGKMKSVYSYVIKLLLLSVLLSAVSCDSLLSYRENKNTPRGNFEALWKMLDRKYCYFEEKGVDWDAVYDKYEPEISDYMTDEELLDVMQRMIRELRDGHVYVSAPFDLARYWDWYLDYPPNFNYNIIERNYLGRNSVLVDGGLESRVIDNIGYIYYSSFSYFDEAGMDYLIKKYRGCDGIILDIRNNNGGITTYGKNMLSYFPGRRTKVGYWKEKTGDGHADFSDYQPLWGEPNRIELTGPVVVLTHRSP